MPPQIPRVELDVAYAHRLLTSSHCTVEALKLSRKQQIQQRGLAGIVQTQQHNVASLGPEAHLLKKQPKPRKRSAHDHQTQENDRKIFLRCAGIVKEGRGRRWGTTRHDGGGGGGGGGATHAARGERQQRGAQFNF